MIKEWNLLRVVACLSIVLLHSTSQTAMVIGFPQIEYYQLYMTLLCYATPTFIVLSVIILANRYPDRLPNKFWINRIKFTFFPFIAFGIIDALVATQFSLNSTMLQKMFDNLITGSFVGWFIIVIFQFYLLHYVVTRFKLSMTWLLPLSILIMIWYLSLINGETAIIPGYDYMLKLPFIAWFGYFAAGFVIGKHYRSISGKLYKYRWLTLLLLGISLYIVFLSYQRGNTAVHSRRMDLFPVVISVTSVVLAWGQDIPHSKIVTVINKYAFGIYLVHWQVQQFIAPITANYFDHTSARVLALFFLTVVISIAIIKIISMLPFGQFIVGKIKSRTRGQVSRPKRSNSRTAYNTQ